MNRVLFKFVLRALLCSVVFSHVTVTARGQEEQASDGAEDVMNVFLPAPRGLRQQLSRAREALEQEQYSDAVDLLGSLLASAHGGDDALLEETADQDYFLGGVDAGGTQVSLKSEAQRLLGEIPEKGRALYELKFGVDARQLLDLGLQSRDMPQLVEVTRRYFHTDAGYEATMLIGRHDLDQGRPLAAAMRFQRLARSPYASRRYDPELSVLLATSWLLADMPDRARSTLEQLASRLPDARLRMGDTTVALFDPEDPALLAAVAKPPADGTEPPQGLDRSLHWLEQTVGTELVGRAREARQWALFRGDPARNAESPGGIPLFSARWRVQTANHPSDEELIREQWRQYRNDSVVAIPTLNPLAVGNIVLMRSPRRLLGVDLETGKRIWEFPWFEAPEESVLEEDQIRPRQQVQDPRAMELASRVWDDAPYGQMSSDGRHVFMLWGLSSSSSQPAIILRQLGIQGAQAGVTGETNRLVALDLQAQGKLRWIVGDEDGTDEPQLAGAFFLGSPLPLMGQLYVLAELQGEIRLVVLNADTGQLVWSQQLAHVDARQIMADPVRRAAGASPSFADGVLVCPTSSGAVVAVDIATRSLLWGYQYPQSDPGNNMAMAAMRYQPKVLGERWNDASVTISDGRVLLTPVESDFLYCLDLVSGQPLWEPLPRDTMLFVGCVHQGKAVMVGKEELRTIALEDGSQGWTCPWQGGVPSGRGIVTAGQYYLPTNNNRLLVFDLREGQIARQLEADVTLGNLVAYRDQIISLNADWLVAYHQTEPLRAVVAKRLEADPQDAWAMARKAELLLQDGQHGLALEVFRQAHQLNPDDDTIRVSLVRSLLAALRDDFAANQRFAVELENLIDLPEQKAEFCRWMAVGLKRQGDFAQATQYIIRLAEMDEASHLTAENDGTELVRVDDQLQVHHDRWLRMQVQEMLAAAPGETRATIDQMIRAHLDAILGRNSRAQLAQFVERFGGHESSEEARLKLAQMLIDDQYLLAAEIELLELEQSANPQHAATAVSMLAHMLLDCGQLEEAARYFQRLEQQWGETATQDGRTGKEIADALLQQPALSSWLNDSDPWLKGKCEVTVDTRSSTNTFFRVFPLEMDAITGPVPTDRAVAYNQNQNSLVLSDGWGKTLQEVSLGDQNRFITTNSVAGRAVAHGHLLFVNMGFDVLAINTLQGEQAQGEVILWHHDLSSRLPLAVRRNRPLMSRLIPRKWGPPRYVSTDESRSPVGMAGPITRLGAIYQKMSDLICVDPLSGQTIWVRSGVEPGSDIFGDPQYLFVVAPESSEARVFLTADGTELGRREVTSRAERWITLGRRVVTCRSDGRQLQIRYFDAWEQKDLWTREVDDNAQCWRPRCDELAVFEPGGNFELLQVDSGQTLVKSQLQAQADLNRLYVLPSRDSYLVVTSARSSGRNSTSVRVFGTLGGDTCPEVNGRVYSLDRATGSPRWSTAAEVHEFLLPLDQPSRAPTLVFLRNQQTPASANEPRTIAKATVLVIDQRDGRQLHLAEDLAMIRNFKVESDMETQTVDVTTNGNNFRLRFTDQPAEEAQPVQIKGEEPKSTKAIQGIGKVAEAILEAITEKEDTPQEAQQPQDENAEATENPTPAAPPPPKEKAAPQRE